jgi:CelD/BcsL family acetyltransferase involved in cellulose biosynthesis
LTIRTEVVTNPARLAAVREPWQALWGRCGGFIFQSFDWIDGWRSGIQDRRNIRFQIALAWDGDRLCGVLACAVHRRSGLRMLTWAAQLFSDYCDCLVDPAYDADAIMGPLWDSLHRFGGFDLINLQQIRPDARCRNYLDRLARDGTRLQHGERSERCMRIENKWTDGEAFFRSQNKKARNNHTRGKRILAELGGGDVNFRLVQSPEQTMPVLEEVIRLKRNWLRANDPGSTLLGHDGLVLRAILDKALHSGLAKIFVLECGGTIAAASVNFTYCGRLEAYFTAYDPAFDRASPGTILIVDYARWAFDNNLSHVDFLRGEEAFKFRMANAETLLSSFSGARTLVGQMAVSGHRWLSRRRQRQEVINARPDDELEAVG